MAIAATARRGLSLERVVPKLIPLAVMIATPLAVGYLVDRMASSQLEKICVAIIGGAAAVALSARPGVILFAAISGFPVVYIAQPLLLKIGMPAGVIRGTAYWKEAVIGALIVCLLRERDRLKERTFDVIDWAALLMVVVLACYLLFPGQFPPEGSLASSDARMLSFRNLAVIPVAVFIGRRLDFEDLWIRRALTGLMIGGCVFGAFSLWEILANDSFQRFVNETLNLDAVDTILGRENAKAFRETNVNGVLVQRAGSLFRLQNQAAFFFVPAVVVSVERLAREGATIWRVAAVGGASAGLILTQTRSAILGAAVAVLFIVRRQSGLPTGVRVRFIGVLLMVGLAAAPFVAGSALGDRFVGAISRSDTSSKEHGQRTPQAFRDVISNPLGHGLGTAGASARRVGRATTGEPAENFYLGVAQEIGIAGGLAFLVLLLASLARLFRQPFGASGAPTAAFAALLGLGITAYFLHAFDGATITLPVFILVGIGLGAGVARPTPSSMPAEVR